MAVIKVALLLLVLVALSYSIEIRNVHSQRSYSKRQFLDFLSRYNKNYDAGEFRQRYEIFTENLKKIDEMNAKSTNAKFGINKFADLSAEEFKKFYLGTKSVVRDPNWETLPNLPEEVIKSTPASWDWRSKGAVTEVKNQGQCGSCWSFSTTGNVEGQWFLAGNALVGLSEQNLVDCDHECMQYEGEEACDAGCDGGLMPNAFHYIIASGGINTEAEYPYEGVDSTCAQNNKTLTGKIDDWKMIPSDEDQMAAYLVQLGPMSVAVDAEAWQFYIGGVLQISFFCGTTLDHGVLIVGYGNETNIIGEEVNFWTIKNSWGGDWGESGYIRIERGEDECGVDIFPCTSLINKKR